MVELNLLHKINIPFAQNGDRDEIPDTSDGGLVNNTDGLGVKYETPVGKGGEYFDREIINGALYKVYAAVKELQDLAVTAGFHVDMTKALNVLPLANGGTGANNKTQARSNLGLGSLATKSTVTSADITNGTITNNDIANNTIKDEKLNGTISISHGGTGRTDGFARGIKDGVVRNENNWQTDNTRGLDVFYWQTADFAKKGLPTIVGAMISNVFTSDIKVFLALNSSASAPELRIKTIKSDWKKLAFDDDVINKMPKATSSSGIGKFQSVVGQGIPVSYRLPDGGTYLYFFSCTYDYNNYSAVDNKAGIAAGGTEIISTSMNLKTFGGFIWRIQ